MTGERPTLYLVRHGQTEWNLQGRLQGGRDSPLTLKGKHQAVAVGKVLVPAMPSLILRSPLGRARKTAEIVGRMLDLPIEEDRRLAEMRFGEAEGLSLVEVDEHWPGFRQHRERDKWHTRWPDGESYEDVSGRIDAFVTERLMPRWQSGDSGSLVIVAHETVNMVLAGRVLDLAPSITMRLGQPNQVIYRLDGRRVDHGYPCDDVLEWAPGFLQKRSDEILHIAA